MPLNVAVLDNFNRANGAVGANWTANPYDDGAVTLAIVSNAIQNDASWYDHAWWNAGTAAVDADHDLEVSVAVVDPPDVASGYALWCNLIQQPSGSSLTADAYEFGFESASGTTQRSYILRKDNAGTPVYLYDVTATSPWVAGDLLIGRLDASGNLSLVRDRAGTETVIGTAVDTNYTGTFFAGCGVYEAPASGTAILDDFAFGAYSITPPAVEYGRFSAVNFPKPKLRKDFS